MDEKKRFIEVAEGIYWVGNYDDEDSLNCNPYLVVEGDEAVVIDAGSRMDFSDVILKILSTGIDIKNINSLIYQHYDPDLCSSIPHMESIIGRDDLTILSHNENNIFIRYYGGSSKRMCIEELGMEYVFKTGRRIKFYRTPYSHSAGSFISLDEKTGTLFTSDLFGFWGGREEIYGRIDEKCKKCRDEEGCTACPKRQLKEFHRRVMSSEKALKYAMEIIEKLPVKIIAPQHGAVFTDPGDISYLVRELKGLKGVGIDGWG